MANVSQSVAKPISERCRLDEPLQAILEKAAIRRQQNADFPRLHGLIEARLQRATDAWQTFSSYRQDTDTKVIPPSEQWRGYANALVALGRVLQTDGWGIRLDAVTAGSNAKIYAVAVLRKAMDADVDAIQTMMQLATEHDAKLALDVKTWLREELMYEVLGIRRAPEPPRGWEGRYLDAVESVEDFVRWIDREFLIQEIVDKGPGNKPSDGRLVRNAFRLVTKLELNDFPAEPLGPWKLQDELAVLRNLRRLCASRIARKNPGDAGSLETCPEADIRRETLASEMKRGSEVRRETADELVKNYLVKHGCATLEEIVKATSLSPSKIWRSPCWKSHEERKLESFLREHPDAVAGDVQRALGHSRSKVVAMHAWKEHRTRREAAQSRRRIESRERPLSEEFLGCRADPKALDPGARIDQREQIFQTLVEGADAGTRASLHCLTSGEREVLIEHFLQTLDTDQTNRREETETRALLLTIAQSWLEERQQQVRHGQRERRRAD